MPNRIRLAVRRVLWLKSLEGRDLPATGLTVWSPLAADPRSWARDAAVWAPQSFSAVNETTSSGSRLALPLRLDEASVGMVLANAPGESMSSTGYVVALPDPHGELQRFRIWEVNMMEPGLAAQFPDIKTYRGQGIDDPTAVLAADVTMQGFHTQVLSEGGRWYIDPQHNQPDLYSVYYRRDFHANGSIAISGADVLRPPTNSGSTTANKGGGGGTQNVGPFGGTLRTYRAAVAGTGEYTAAVGGSVSAGQSAILTAINRVSGVFETELSIRMVLVANNSSLVFTNAATDGYTNGDEFSMSDENQPKVDSIIGSANYDIGHVFGSGGGGVASFASVGQAGRKANAATMGDPLNDDSFYIDYVAHEMGHQFGADHTFNGTQGGAAGNVNPPTAVETGSGSTIMSYAGICDADDIQDHSDAFFHAASLTQIQNFVTGTGGAGGNTQTATGNAIPAVNGGADFTIPANTPYALTAVGADGDSTASLTYSWEEMDVGSPQSLVGFSDNGSSPIQRAFAPSTSPTRVFPRLSNLVNNTTAPGEFLPTTSRGLNYRVTIRDNRAGGGAINSDDVKLTVINSAGPFVVTAPNTAVTWVGGSTQTVSWNVAGTTGGGINTALVRILFSSDGGFTYPTVVLAGTANDGSESVTIPNIETSKARMKVEAVGNIFFDISNVDFKVTPGTGGIVVTNNNPSGTGSLRQAIISANTAPGPDTITFDPSFFATAKTISFSAGGEMAITEAVRIFGPAAGVTVNANNTSRVFNTSAAANGAAIIISNMTITGGNTSADGGGIFVGEEALTLINCVVSGNSAGTDGGGINVESNGITLASLTLQNTAVTGNIANDDGGGVYFLNGGAALVENSTISGNKANVGDGGGIYFNGTVSAGGLLIRNSTLFGNSTGVRGGGIALPGATGSGTLVVLGSTITANTAAGAGGGGIFRAANSIVINVENSIVAGNTNATAPDISSPGTVNQKSSAVGSNSGFTQTNQGGNLAFGVNLRLAAPGSYGGPTQTVALLPGSPAINAGSSTISNDQRGSGRVGAVDMGAFESQGFTFGTAGSGQTTKTNTAFANPLVVTVTPAKAGEPVDGGVVTFTAPVTGASASLSASTVTIAASKAQVTATSNGTKGTYNVVATTTPNGSASFALSNDVVTEAPSLVVTLTTDTVNAQDNKTSLREAINYANSIVGADTVSFDTAVFASAQTITLTAGQLAITEAVTITGPGAKLLNISGGGASRVFFLNIPAAGAAVAMSGLTVSGGSAVIGANINGAGFLLGDDTLTLTECAVVGNTASGDGGGIHIDNGGSLIVRYSTFSNNKSNWGAAIDFYSNGGTLLMENSTVSGNTATANGGGIYFGGTNGGGLTIRNSTLTGNSAGSGGGIFRTFLSTSTISLTSSIVSGNFDSGLVPDIYSSTPVTANFSAIGSNGGHSTIGANNLAYGADLKLGALADNGGPTQTHALLPGSAAINKGANPQGFGTDQRGFSYSRAIDQPDIGAFEAQPTAAPPPTATVTIDSGAGQRSMIQSITVTFSEAVTLGANPFTVERLNTSTSPTPSGVVTLSIAGSGSAYTITFNDATFAPMIGSAKSLIDGKYTVTLNAGQITSVATGLQLDGDGNATAGDNQATNFFRLFGDVRGASTADLSGNGFTDNVDLLAFRMANGSSSLDSNYDVALDINGDGFIDNLDLLAFRQRLGVTP